MTLSTNRLLTAQYVFIEHVGEFQEFELLNYGKEHPDSCCRCLEIKATIDLTKIDNLNKFLELKKVAKKTTTRNTNSIQVTFLIGNNSVRNYFMNLYRKMLPTPKEYLTPPFFHTGEMKLLIYKSINLGTLEYKILDSLCQDTKAIKGDVESAIYLRRNELTWYIEGTGCTCSNFRHIPPSEISRENILSIIEHANIQFELMKSSS